MPRQPDTFDALIETLSQDIYSGALRPGEWLKQIDVVNRYGAKPFFARKALQQLEQKGLAEYEKNKGFRVAHPSEAELIQVKEIRGILEVGVAPVVIRNMDPQTLERLRDLASAFEEAIETASKETLRKLNFEFHDKMVRVCGNPMLADMIDELRKRQIPGTRDVWSTVLQQRESARQHFDMIAALEAGDETRFKDIVHLHIFKDVQDLMTGDNAIGHREA